MIDGNTTAAASGKHIKGHKEKTARIELIKPPKPPVMPPTRAERTSILPPKEIIHSKIHLSTGADCIYPTGNKIAAMHTPDHKWVYCREEKRRQHHTDGTYPPTYRETTHAESLDYNVQQRESKTGIFSLPYLFYTSHIFSPPFIFPISTTFLSMV
jgi:hypothetical protein